MRAIASLTCLAALCALAAAARPQAAPARARQIEMRGTVSQLPFWLGTTMYGNQWKVDVEGSNWWYDKGHWNRHFDELVRLKLNALFLLHPDPYPAFVDVPGYPEARYLSPEELARSREMLRWILAEAKQHGVRIYLLTWNVNLPPGLQKAHNLPESGADTPLTRAFTRAAVAATFRDFPGLAGIATMAAETPPGCVDFVVEGICAGLRDSGRNPELIFWSWCSYPEDSRRILSAYPNTRLLHYLQYEQYFKPMADPRIGRFSKACGNAPMVALGGPKSCHGYLYWCDPEWARLTVRSLREQNGTGFIIESYHADPEIGREALAYYAANPDEPYSPARWEKRFGEVYGRPDLGKPLLAAAQAASRILPRFVTLVHSQTDHYAPQLGLPLVYYTDMPTLSSYVFENVQTLDPNGYLRPNLGLCWPNPDWGEKVVGVREYARSLAGRDARPTTALHRPTTTGPGPSSRQGSDLAGRRASSPAGRDARPTTPADIAGQIEALASTCRANVRTARAALKPSDSERLRSLLDLLDLSAALGDHYAAKVRAAIDWERWRAGNEASGAACVKHLSASVDAWEQVVAVANRIYPGNVGYWRSEMASAPPWTQNQIWESYAMVQGHWRDNLEPFRQELALVREEIARGPRSASLPLWEALRAVPASRLTPVFADGFDEAGTARRAWDPGATRTAEASEVLAGAGAALLDSRGLPGEWHMMLRSDRAALRLAPGKRYQVTFRYRVVDPGKEYASPFAVAARSDKGGVPADIGSGRTWGAAKGAAGTRTVLLEPRSYDDYYLFFSIHGAAAVVIDDLRVAEVGAR